MTKEQTDNMKSDVLMSLMANLRVAMTLSDIKVIVENRTVRLGPKLVYLFDNGKKVAADYDAATGTLTWREGGTSKDQDALIKIHASTYGDYRGPVFKKTAEEGVFVIVRNDGKFVAVPGKERSYTTNLQDARTFPTRDAAFKELCVENERIEPVYGLLKKPE